MLRVAAADCSPCTLRTTATNNRELEPRAPARDVATVVSMDIPHLEPLAVVCVAGVTCVVVKQDTAKAEVVYLDSGEPIVNDVVWTSDPWHDYCWRFACGGGVFANNLERFRLFVHKLLQHRASVPAAAEADGMPVCELTGVAMSPNVPVSH